MISNETTREIRRRVIRQYLHRLANRSENQSLHAARVAVYSVAMADALGFSEDALEEIFYGASLHDIAKVSWPQRLLGPIPTPTPTDSFLIQNHPLHSVQLISRFGWLKRSRDGILHHHERWDGSGYPLGLKREEIPVSARIIGLAEVFDSLTMPCGWQTPIPEAQAIETIKGETEKRFDPLVAEAFFKIQPIVQPIGL
jgi:HD-GYP domain-containing protein (c-di-GMP phosphodiesterase class II)